MSYKIELLKEEDYGLLVDLVSRIGKEYKLKKDCVFIVSKNEKQLNGALGIEFGKYYPQLKHLIIDKGSHPKIAIRLIEEMEKKLLEKGFKEYVGFANNNDNKIQSYAQRLGFRAYAGVPKGVWFHKRIKEEDNV